VKNPTLAQAQELAMSMKAAAKHSSELHGGANMSYSTYFTAVEEKIMHLASAILRLRNARFAVNKAS